MGPFEWKATDLLVATDPAILNYLRNSNVKLTPESDGDFYRIIRHFESIGNKRLASTWKSKIKGSKARFFKIVFRLVFLHWNLRINLKEQVPEEDVEVAYDIDLDDDEAYKPDNMCNIDR